jgi:hypothetical protein
MVRERLLRVLQTGVHTQGDGRKLSSHIQDAYRGNLHKIRRDRLAHQTLPRMSIESLRNRVVIQEVKLV